MTASAQEPTEYPGRNFRLTATANSSTAFWRKDWSPEGREGYSTSITADASRVSASVRWSLPSKVTRRPPWRDASVARWKSVN